MSITVDVVIFIVDDSNPNPAKGNVLKALLIKRSYPPFKGQWALPGGFLRKNELAINAAKRVLRDKAGVVDFKKANAYLEQLYTFDDIGRDPRGRVITISYFALVSESKIKIDSEENFELPALYAITSLPKLAFDHRNIISYALKRLRAKLEYTNIVFSLLPPYFTLSQLQKTYEIILNKKIDKRNFRKKFLSLELIRPTRSLLQGIRQRPARLYEFMVKQPTELKKFF